MLQQSNPESIEVLQGLAAYQACHVQLLTCSCWVNTSKLGIFNFTKNESEKSSDQPFRRNQHRPLFRIEFDLHTAFVTLVSSVVEQHSVHFSTDFSCIGAAFGNEAWSNVPPKRRTSCRKICV
jgi:hypothetical protein